MGTRKDYPTAIAIPPGLCDALRDFPVIRNVEHCGKTISVSPLAIYSQCPHCGMKLRFRAFSAVDELEDVIDAVLIWMNNPAARHVAEQRAAELREEEDE
jgi:hypothetical protein